MLCVRLRRLKNTNAYAAWVNDTFAYDRSTGRRVNMLTGETFEDQVFENEFGPGWARSGGKGSLINAIKTGKAGLNLQSVMLAAAFPGKDRMVPIDMGTHQDHALNTWYDTTLPAAEGQPRMVQGRSEAPFPKRRSSAIDLVGTTGQRAASIQGRKNTMATGDRKRSGHWQRPDEGGASPHC